MKNLIKYVINFVLNVIHNDGHLVAHRETRFCGRNRT